jgi:hypothetical protein
MPSEAAMKTRTTELAAFAAGLRFEAIPDEHRTGFARMQFERAAVRMARYLPSDLSWRPWIREL